MASILFVHGAGHAAWCWHEHFTSWFEARGYTVAAPDLPHHGGLDRRGIKFTPLRAYVDAVGSAADGLKPPLIIVGHSMGGFVATARAYHTTPRIVPGGHDVMLDTAWEQVAMAIETAIAERVSIGYDGTTDRTDDLEERYGIR